MAHTIRFDPDGFDKSESNGVVTISLETQAALTATSTGVDTVDATYGAPEQAALTTTRLRVDEIEAALIAVGLLAAPA